MQPTGMVAIQVTLWYCWLCVTILVPNTSGKMLQDFLLAGSHTPCNEGEGEKVVIAGITDRPCIVCTCQGGQVECDRQDCGTLDGCHAILFDRPKDTCCDVCKGCHFNGTHYPSGSTWSHPTNPCVLYQCQAGVQTQSAVKCHVDCKHPLHLSGQCCASCSDCSFDGMDRKDGETFPHNSRGDVTCTCKAGRVHCSYRACPVLNCPPDAYYVPPGQHCPKCKGERKIFNVPNSCFFAKRVYAQGTLLRPDDCTTCTCHAGTVHCHRESCLPAPCDVKDYVYGNGTCCPSCPDLQDCLSDNRSYPAGHHWLNPVTCQQCHCDSGAIYCRRQSCPKIPSCAQGHSLEHQDGSCCPQCVRDNAICSVSDDSRHVTFDAREFHAHGGCRYHLARDCRRHTFFIKIRNSPNAGDAFWTELVAVGFGNSTIINLYRSLQARVNRHPVELPYVRSSEFSIHREGQKIVVDAYEQIGVKVVWEGLARLEVTVSKDHRHNLCGLCGNNNGDPADDFQDKRGKVLTNADDFLSAWHVRVQCQTAKGPVSSADLAAVCPPGSGGAAKAEGYCGGFFMREFKACASRIDMLPYVRWCLYDACLCPREGACHFRSIRSLARRCKRAGFPVRWWRVARWRHQDP